MIGILAIAAANIQPVHAAREPVTTEGITYTLNDDNKTAVVSGHTDALPNEIVIPETVRSGEEEYTVTSIGDSAFESCGQRTSVTIPASVTSIDDSAFYLCGELTTVTFKDGSLLTSIGDSAFESCYNLADITIPQNVTSIGNSAFLMC